MIPSERPGHALIENWNPLGVIGEFNLVPTLKVDLNSRHHHCFQLPRGRLRLELGPGDVLRQHNGVEGSPDHPPHLHRHHQVGDECCTAIQFPTWNPRCVADVLERNSLPGAISTLCQVLSFFSINNSIVLHSGTDMGICYGNVLHCKLPIAELIYQGIGNVNVLHQIFSGRHRCGSGDGKRQAGQVGQLHRIHPGKNQLHRLHPGLNRVACKVYSVCRVLPV